MRLQSAFPDVERAKKWESAWVCTGGLNHQPYRPWSQHKGIAAQRQPAGPGLVNIVFPAPSPFLQETPPLPQLGRCFSAYTLEPTTQAQGGVRGPTGAAQPAAPGSLSSTKRPNPQTQEKPELSQLANTQASCPSVCGRASCWRKGGLQLCSDIPGWWPGTASWHPTWAAAALLRAAVSRHSQGRWGQAVGAVKRNLREQRKL